MEMVFGFQKKKMQRCQQTFLRQNESVQEGAAHEIELNIETRQITDRTKQVTYALGEFLGKGAFGNVHKVYSQDN